MCCPGTCSSMRTRSEAIQVLLLCKQVLAHAAVQLVPSAGATPLGWYGYQPWWEGGKGNSDNSMMMATKCVNCTPLFLLLAPVYCSIAAASRLPLCPCCGCAAQLLQPIACRFCHGVATKQTQRHPPHLFDCAAAALRHFLRPKAHQAAPLPVSLLLLRRLLLLPSLLLLRSLLWVCCLPRPQPPIVQEGLICLQHKRRSSVGGSSISSSAGDEVVAAAVAGAMAGSCLQTGYCC